MVSATSKISLGTVQFGQEYGIANKTGRVRKDKVFEILNYARSVGVDALDTASAYGESESVLGEYLGANSGTFKVVSKTPPLEPGQAQRVGEFLEQSLRRLNVKQLDGYLLHRFKDLFFADDVWGQFLRLKETGRTKAVGFSLYSPEEMDYLLSEGVAFDVVQVPYSVFDRRFEKYFPVLNERGITVQVRSVFLQGLAFLSLDEFPAWLEGARPQLSALRRIADNENIPVAAVCLNFALMNPNVGKVVIGVDSLAHLKDNISGTNFMDKVKGVYEQLSGVTIEQEDILLPPKWSVVCS